MKTIINFTKPRNEATVKLYTDVSENVWASSPNIFTQKLRSGSSLPDIVKINLTQFILHSLNPPSTGLRQAQADTPKL